MDYRPIDCALHDVLEAAAIRRQACRIRFRTDDGRVSDVVTTIEDVWARDGAEYARLGSGPVIRLDRLQEVEPLPTASGDRDGRVGSLDA